jgi:hypothetical protein
MKSLVSILFLLLLITPFFSPPAVRADCDVAGNACCHPEGGTGFCKGNLICTVDLIGSTCKAPQNGNEERAVDVQQGGNTTQSALCGTDNKGVDTAIGCLMAGDPKWLISQLLGWGVSVAGGIAFIMIVISGFQMTTAAGDVKKVQAAKELMVSAISGLILVVMSLVIMNFIGFGLLGLPTFNIIFN